MAESAPRGWVNWYGGDNPVPARVVKVVTRGGGTYTMLSDHVAGWKHVGAKTDVVAYQVM